MLLFLNMQISVFASDNCTVVKIPVRQIFDSEVEGIADEFSYIMTTDQSGAPMPAEAATCSIPDNERMQLLRLR